MAEAKAYKMIPHCTMDTITYEMDELVRCKDCRWADVSDNEHTWCGHVDDGFCHNNDWFCADGEKKLQIIATQK